MRVNAKALMKVAGIGCFLDDGTREPRPARIALVTEQTVQAAREMGVSDPGLRATETSPQLRYGGALAYVDEGEGSVRRVILAPGQGEEFRLPCGLRFLGSHMFDAERLLPQDGPGDRPFLLGLIRSIFIMVASIPDPDRFPGHLVAQAFRSSLRASFGDAHLPLTDGQLVLKSCADLLRSRIAGFDARHPDAIGTTVPLDRILDQVGMNMRADGIEVPGVGRIGRRDARRLVEDKFYKSGLFERLTHAPSSRIEGLVLTIEEAQAMTRSLPGSCRTGAWVEAFQEVANGLTGLGDGAYRLKLDLHAHQGRDLLILSDTIGQESGFVLLFSWPSHERAPVLCTAGGPVYAFCPEEVPGTEDLIRLQRVVHDLDQEHRQSSLLKQAYDA